MKARDLFELGPMTSPAHNPGALPRPVRREPGMNPRMGGPAPTIAPSKPITRPGERPTAPPAPSRFPSPSRRKFPGKREQELPKPKACGSATKYESRASLIVKRLLA